MRNEKGIALMLVLTSILIISTVVVDFAYKAHIAYEVSASERDRLKATYLAHSAYQLVRMTLRYERQLRRQYAQILSELQGTEMADPFCKIFPISTGLIQGLASGELSKESSKESKEKEEGGGSEGQDEGEDPFRLGGDFEGSCDTEEKKINLNAFWQPPDKAFLYEEQKSLLYNLLTQKSFEPIFKGVDEVRDVVNAIADWADLDDRINEAPGVQGSYEESLYSNLPYKPKNGKYTSLGELLLIPGIGDELYRLLLPHVTVFGDHRINLCQASEEMIRAFLIDYSLTTPGASRLNPDDEPKIVSLVESVREVCQGEGVQPAQVANVITSQLGGNPSTTDGKGSKGLASRLVTSNRFYRVSAVGSSGEVTVKLHAVLDTEKSDPNLWKTLYFLVE